MLKYLVSTFVWFENNGKKDGEHCDYIWLFLKIPSDQVFYKSSPNGFGLF